MVKIIVGTTSERKLNVVKSIFTNFHQGINFEIGGFAAESRVPDTPYDKETFLGAQNRAKQSKQHDREATYAVGLESGLVERYGHVYEEAWAVVIDREGKEYFGYSSGLKVPDSILQEMDRLGQPHSEVMTLIEEKYGKLPNDTWGTYTGGLLLRTISLEEALRNALIQIVGPEKSFYKTKV